MKRIHCNLLMGFVDGVEMAQVQKHQFPKILRIPHGEAVPLVEG